MEDRDNELETFALAKQDADRGRHSSTEAKVCNWTTSLSPMKSSGNAGSEFAQCLIKLYGHLPVLCCVLMMVLLAVLVCVLMMVFSSVVFESAGVFSVAGGQLIASHFKLDDVRSSLPVESEAEMRTAFDDKTIEYLILFCF
ncbi:hypothetical protein Ancab_004501 [Ancistrocladus abbreviatus]